MAAVGRGVEAAAGADDGEDAADLACAAARGRRAEAHVDPVRSREAAHLHGDLVEDGELSVGDADAENVELAGKLIESNLFRPPYGRITRSQIHKIKADKNLPQEIIMWDVLSADFDEKITGEQCAKNVIKNAGPGSIIVFHDSAKAWDRLHIALPLVLNYFSTLGYRFEAITSN